MGMSRRDFIRAGCAIASATPSGAVVDRAEAALRGSVVPQFSQRSVINLGFINDNSYPFINFFLGGDGCVGPVGSAFSTGTPWPALIDANGWPNQPGVNGTNFGGSVRIPGADEYAGNWVMTWSGNGRLDLTLGGGTWTEKNLVTAGAATISIANPAVVTFPNTFSAGQQIVFTTSGVLPTGLSINTVYYVLGSGLSGSSFQISATMGGGAIATSGTQSGTHRVNGTYVKNANGRWSNAFDTISPYIVVAFSRRTGPQLIPVIFSQTDPELIGNYLKSFKFYQQGDEPDLLAGKIFRVNYKQLLVNLNPSAIRFLNWYGANATRECRFENRTLPTNAGYGYFTNWVASPSYPAATGTNIYSVGAAVPTTANPKTAPATLTHGEVALIRFTNASVRGNQYTVNSISNAATPTVTTAAAHGLATDDIVVHSKLVGGTFSKLNFFPCKVTVLTTTTYTIQTQAGGVIDTSAYGTFSSGVGTQYWSIDVGGRGAKPMAHVRGDIPGSVFGDNIAAGGYGMLVYDKNIAVLGDGNGNLIYGAWTVDGAGQNGLRGDVPLEIMTALVNEVNALSVSQGITTPINMWINFPHTGLTSMDSDYTAASDFAVNSVDVILNAASTQRANGYSALTSNAKLFIEYNNETWNNAGGFWSTYYLARMGALRWPGSGTTDYVDMAVLRSTIVMRAVASQFGTGRIKRVLAGQGAVGFAFNSLNEARTNGCTTAGLAGNYYTTDSLVVGGGFGKPIDNHDCFATATYLDASPLYYGSYGCSISIANPAIATITNAFKAGDRVFFTGNVPTGVTTSTVYYVLASGLSKTAFQFSLTNGGTPVATSGSAVTGTSANFLGKGSFTDDSAMYNGTNNSANSGGNYVGAANQAQAITNFVSWIYDSGQAINFYLDNSLSGVTATYASAMKALGKTAINYEGGPDWQTRVGDSLQGVHTITAADRTFILAVMASTQWRDAQVGYFNRTSQLAGSAMPSVYLYIGNSTDQRWSYCTPDSFGGTSTEGQGLLNSAVWVGMGARNQALGL